MNQRDAHTISRPEPGSTIGLLALAGALVACAPPGLPDHPVSAEDRLVREGRRAKQEARAAASGRLERLRFLEAERLDSLFAWGRFLSQHPDGLFSERARDRQAILRFEQAERHGGLSGFRRFLRLHPTHRLAPKAWRLLLAVEGRELLAKGSRGAIRAFLDRHPRGELATALRRRLERMEFDLLGKDSSVAALESYLSAHPSSPSVPEVRTRLERRLAERVGALGDRAAVRRFLDRFPGSRHASALQRRSFAREAVDAIVQRDVLWLRSELPRQLDGAVSGARLKAVLAWLQGGAARLAALGPLVAAAAPFRPRGRPLALVAAARVGDPPTAAFALRALSHVPSLEAANAIVERLPSPDAGVSLEAVRALGLWARRAPSHEARRLLLDLLAEQQARKDTTARVTELGILHALGDKPKLLDALRGRTWHRPWNVLPHVLWLEALEPGSPEAARVGPRAVEVLREELRRLGRVLPAQLGDDTRQRAVAVQHELGEISHSLQQLQKRHTGGQAWTEQLRGLAQTAEQRADAARRAVAARFPDQQTADPGETDQEAARHEASRAAALGKLRERLAALRVPDELLRLFCGSPHGQEILCPAK